MYLIVPIFFLLTWRISGRSIYDISITNIVFIFLFIFTYLGFPILYFELDPYRVNIGITNQNIILITFLLSALSMWMFQLGVIFSDIVVTRKPDMLPRNIKISSIKKTRHVLIFMFPFLAYVIFNYISLLDEVALFIALFEVDSNIGEARSNMTNAFSGSYHWYSLVIHEFSALFCYTSYVVWYFSRKMHDLALFILYFLFCFIAFTLSGEKAPIVLFIIALALTHLVISGNIRLSKSIILFGFFLIFSFLIILYRLFMGEENIYQASINIFSRAFAGSITPMYFYYEYVPDYRDYLLGATMPNPGSILPFNPVELSKEINVWIFSGSGDVIASSPTGFWAEAYANFSYIGVVIISFFMGFYLSIIGVLTSKFIKNPLMIGFYIWLIFWMKNISVTTFWIAIINVKLYLIVLFILMVNFFYFRNKEV